MQGVLGLLVISLLASADGSAVIDMEGKTCIDYDCHAALQSKAFVHGPLNKGSCSPCHVQLMPNLHHFELSRKKEELCQTCHILSMRNYIHQPVADGDCVGCHDPHQSDFQSILRADPSKDLCFFCHARDAFMKKQKLHEPVADGACILCHEPHSSWIPELVVARGRKLCMPCHQDSIQADSQARHVHPPLEDQCVQCHDPHSSDWPSQILDEPRKLCVSCHEEIEQLIAASPIVHSPVNQEQQCQNCHHGHGSMLPKLLKKSALDTCLTCHDRQITLKDGRKTEDMVALLKENPNHHGPIRQADCSACHEPHGSSLFSLLKQAYPELFYAPFDPNIYKLCFGCHREELVSSQDGVGVTQFRDGQLNLHYVHVSRESRGRTCRACHAVHASKNYAHISESVPYGQWQYRLNFEQKENGGGCNSACHKAREYDRTKTTPAAGPPKESSPAK